MAFATANPYVAHCSLASLSNSIEINNASLNEEDGILFQDLRGVDCFAQPDALVVCGLGDTIPIMLFTKSVEPIFDVELNVSFSPGLEYATFAFVDDPGNLNNADLDTINVDNVRSPTFRISEVNQEDGGVVVYIGVNAQCGIDFDTYEPEVSFNLSYVTANGVRCRETFTPATGYAENVLNPRPGFTGAATPTVANFTDINTPNCITTQLTNVTPGAGLTEALYFIEDFGFDLGIEFSSLSVNGIDVPVTDYTVDDQTGRVSAIIDGNTNPAYWGPDGQLTTMESIPIEACFVTSGCTGVMATPVFTVQSACNGEVCGGSVDVQSGAQLGDRFTFNPTVDLTFDQIAEAAFCNPDEPTPYVYEVSVQSSIPDSIRGDVYNLRYFIDRCPEQFLDLATVELLDGPGGNVLGSLPDTLSVLAGANSNGRVFINFRNLPVGLDPDGAGGLEDIDGDGVFDDLQGGNTLYFRVSLVPSCDPDEVSTESFSEVGRPCDFVEHFINGTRNCGAFGFTFSDPVDDGVGSANNTSIGEFTNTSPLEVRDIIYDGYHNVGSYNEVDPDTVDVSFEYTLDPDDFAACPSDGTVRLRVNLEDNIPEAIESFEIIEPTFNGTPTTIIDDTTNLNVARRSFTLDAGDGTPGVTYTYTFRIVMSERFCSARRVIALTAAVIQDCDACDCNLTRAGGFTTLTADPANLGTCSAGSSMARIQRISTGYPSRDLSGQRLDPDDVPLEDQTRLLPGDTIEVSGWIAVDEPNAWNNLTQRLSFSLNQFEAGSSSNRIFSNHRVEIAEARLQYARLERLTGETFDLGAVPVPGTQAQNTSGISGANVMVQTVAPFDNVHPGISNPEDYDSGIYRNSSLDFRDGNDMRLAFFSDYAEGDQDGLAALYDHINGNFEQDDTIYLAWRLPIVSTPKVLANGEPTFFGPTVDSTQMGFFVEARNWIDEANRVGTGVGQVGISPRADARMFFHEPGVTTSARIEFDASGCAAEFVQTFETTNPLPAGWFQQEFRPIIGVEYLGLEVPRPYYYGGGATVTHFDQPSQAIVPDSSVGLVTFQEGPDEFFLPVQRNSGLLFFRDAEFSNGLRPDDFVGFDQGANDKSLVGGTFPLLGVGRDAAVDSLVFRVPISRVCGQAVAARPLETVTSVSYRAITDYNIPTYTCNDGSFYSGDGNPLASCAGFPGRYWPYDRDDDGNPHHLLNDSIVEATEVGPLPTTLSASQSFTPAGPLVDAPGPEMIEYSVTLNQDIDGGVIVFTAENAVDVISVDGSLPVMAGATDSTQAFVLDLGARAAGTYTFDLEIDLLFCGPGAVCAQVIPGCNDDPVELGLVVLRSDIICGADSETCVEYISGLPDLETVFNFQNNQQLCSGGSVGG
ncbi:hypothetical protein A3850_010750 [Lewinella sp. 4G2]|nr:hypothetical protein A3850_010750 [Lewinella sp. 4G2]